MQTRTVVCREDATGAIAPDAQCAGVEGPKPATAQACTAACPTYAWQAGDWSACSVACGDGVQMRAVRCIDELTGAVVDDALCTDPMPEESQRCSYPDLLAPVMECPAPATLECAGGGATYTFAATATDGCDGAALAATCVGSGATFPVGSTGLTCAAVDRRMG